MPKLCSIPHCGKIITRGSRCSEHATRPRKWRHTDKRTGRANSSQRGYNARWERARLSYLKQHPLCVHCLAAGISTAANVVDHIIRHQGQDDPLFWDCDNWQPLCVSCHSKKTRAEEKDYQ